LYRLTQRLIHRIICPGNGYNHHFRDFLCCCAFHYFSVPFACDAWLHTHLSHIPLLLWYRATAAARHSASRPQAGFVVWCIVHILFPSSLRIGEALRGNFQLQ
jgi:hypothetical protein